ncbi:hypothetical protein PG994_003421 [Apiospora phragmitis]|uniref:Uncharacterized protein n=1 Tax=Apiospora phragmitis TaxID=2905665 RepID=A0ABR1VY48_9PEZI
MEVRTTTKSMEGQTPDANGLITSIFSFSCDVNMVISDLSGTVYTWEVAEDGISTQMVAEPPTDDTQVLMIPDTMPPGYDPNYAAHDPTLTKRHSRYGSMPNANILEARRNPYTDGQQARVPSYPPNLYSGRRDNTRDMESNGCGSGSTRAWILQLNFGWCCDMHDYCYDNCLGGNTEKCNSQYCTPSEWERCNSAFYDCMHGTACPQYSWWGSPLKRARCEAEAVFYAWAVRTYKGSDAFKDANSQRCGAFCPGTNKPLCHGDCLDHSYDNNNCGSCGVTCDVGHLFNCRNGQCVCTADT